MPVPEMRHTISAQPIRMIRFHARTREYAADRPQVDVTWLGYYKLRISSRPLACPTRTASVLARHTTRYSRLLPTPQRVDFYTVLIGPGYCDTKVSTVRSVTPSTVACATRILSKGSL